jgi:hypothetical protein
MWPESSAVECLPIDIQPLNNEKAGFIARLFYLSVTPKHSILTRRGSTLHSIRLAAEFPAYVSIIIAHLIKAFPLFGVPPTFSPRRSRLRFVVRICVGFYA